MFSLLTDRPLIAPICLSVLMLAFDAHCTVAVGAEPLTQDKRSIDADATFDAFRKRVSGKKIADVTALPELAAFRGTGDDDTTDARTKLTAGIDRLLFHNEDKRNQARISARQLEDVKQAVEFMADRYNTFDRSDKIPRYLRNLVILASRTEIIVPELGKYDYGKSEIIKAAALALAETGAIKEVEDIKNYVPDIATQLLKAAKEHPRHGSPNAKDSSVWDPQFEQFASPRQAEPEAVPDETVGATRPSSQWLKLLEQSLSKIFEGTRSSLSAD